MWDGSRGGKISKGQTGKTEFVKGEKDNEMKSGDTLTHLENVPRAFMPIECRYPLCKKLEKSNETKTVQSRQLKKRAH